MGLRGSSSRMADESICFATHSASTKIAIYISIPPLTEPSR